MTTSTPKTFAGEIIGVAVLLMALAITYACINATASRLGTSRLLSNLIAAGYTFVLLPICFLHLTPVLGLVLFVVALFLESFSQGI